MDVLSRKDFWIGKLWGEYTNINPLPLKWIPSKHKLRLHLDQGALSIICGSTWKQKRWQCNELYVKGLRIKSLNWRMGWASGSGWVHRGSPSEEGGLFQTSPALLPWDSAYVWLAFLPLSSFANAVLKDRTEEPALCTKTVLQWEKCKVLILFQSLHFLLRENWYSSGKVTCSWVAQHSRCQASF